MTRMMTVAQKDATQLSEWGGDSMRGYEHWGLGQSEARVEAPLDDRETNDERTLDDAKAKGK